MIDSVLNLVFRCAHHRITRPITPVRKVGEPVSETYVVCLDCGKQFLYDLEQMQIGKPVHHTEPGGVLPPNMPKPRTSKVKVAMVAAALPVGWLLGMAWKKSRRRDAPKE